MPTSKSLSASVLFAIVLPLPTVVGQTVSYDFTADTFTHSGGSSTGWDPSELSGSVSKSGIELDIDFSFVGGAAADSNGTPQNLDNTTFGSSVFVLALDQATTYNDVDTAPSLTAYFRMDLTFSQPVLLDDFTLEDVDSRDIGTNDYTDGVFIESYDASFGAPGTGSAATYSVGSHLREVSAYGGLNVVTLDEAYLGTNDNLPLDPVHQATASLKTPTQRLSLYYFNTEPPSSGVGSSEQVIAFGNFQVTAIPEPSSGLLGAMALLFVLFIRRRTVNQT